MMLSAYLRAKLKFNAILQHFNRQYPNISFICDSESSRSLPFFDLLVTHSDYGSSTNLYRIKCLLG